MLPSLKVNEYQQPQAFYHKPGPRLPSITRGLAGEHNNVCLSRLLFVVSRHLHHPYLNSDHCHSLFTTLSTIKGQTLSHSFSLQGRSLNYKRWSRPGSATVSLIPSTALRPVPSTCLVVISIFYQSQASGLTTLLIAGRPTMKYRLLFTVVASVSLFATLPFCSARPRSHLHHRNDRLPRVARVAPASSGSSLVGEGSNGLCGELPSTQTWSRLSAYTW